MDVKEKCAEAALPWIESGMTIGLGGGSTIQHLINKIHADELDVTIVTPSFVTRRACLEKGLRVVETGDVSLIDLAFDGCDRVDARHTHKKAEAGFIQKKNSSRRWRSGMYYWWMTLNLWND